jgi:Family of unknown function (DUF6279)
MRVPLPAAMTTTERDDDMMVMMSGVQVGEPTPRRGLGIISFVFAAMLLLLSACSTIRLGYGQAPTLAYHWIDSWVDFDDAQAIKAREGLEATMRWHRRTQLPDYAQWLDKTSLKVLQDITADEVCRASSELTTRWMTLIDQMLPAATEIAATLSDAQLARIQKRFDEGMKRFRDDYAKPDPKAREETSFKRLVSRSETLYGSLDEAQTALLTRAAKTPTFDPEVVIAERTLRQGELMQIIKEGRRAVQQGPREPALAQMRLALRQWSEQAMQSARPSYRAYQKRMQEANCDLSAQVHNVGGAPVRQAARERLKGWETDARALAAAAEP